MLKVIPYTGVGQITWTPIVVEVNIICVDYFEKYKE